MVYFFKSLRLSHIRIVSATKHFLIWVLWPVKIISLILSWDNREKPPDHQQAELGFSNLWPKLGSNPQWWDDEQFRVLNISDFNHYGLSIISLILSRDNREKPPDHPQAELGFSNLWPQLGSNPQRWDDEQFRALNISDFNHSAMGVSEQSLH